MAGDRRGYHRILHCSADSAIANPYFSRPRAARASALAGVERSNSIASWQALTQLDGELVGADFATIAKGLRTRLIAA